MIALGIWGLVFTTLAGASAVNTSVAIGFGTLGARSQFLVASVLNSGRRMGDAIRGLSEEVEPSEWIGYVYDQEKAIVYTAQV